VDAVRVFALDIRVGIESIFVIDARELGRINKLY